MRDHVAVIGCGMMGSGIGAMSALYGNKTFLIDTCMERARLGLEKALDCIAIREQNGLSAPEEAHRARSLLIPCDDMTAAMPATRLIIEAIIEDLPAKQQLFRQLDALVPAEVPICSNTSGLRITDISALCAHPERTLTTHFWLPAHLVPLVEVVVGNKTDVAVAEHVARELKAWKKAPVLVKRDLPGQLANRIFQAIIREAIDIVASGLASAEDVDTAISYGMAMRFPEWGPLKHLDAIGLQLGLQVQDSVLPGLCSSQTAGRLLRDMVNAGHTGAAAGQGFYDWHTRSIDEDMKKRDAFIIAAVKDTARIESDM